MRDFSKLFEPVVESMGYELVGVEFLGAGGHGTLRVYIDRDSGASLPLRIVSKEDIMYHTNQRVAI